MTKRDSQYFKRRLRDEHPAIHADLLAGRYPTVRAASIAAGLVKPRTRLDELKNAWTKATAAERTAFDHWRSGTGAAASSGATPGPAVINGYLQPWASARIDEIRQVRKMTYGNMMLELGGGPLDGSIGNAQKEGEKKSRLLNRSLIDALEQWLKDNAAVRAP